MKRYAIAMVRRVRQNMLQAARLKLMTVRETVINAITILTAKAAIIMIYNLIFIGDRCFCVGKQHSGFRVLYD